MILTGNQPQSGTQQVLITSSQSENQPQGIKFLNNSSSNYGSPTKNITLAQMGIFSNKQHILPSSSPKQVRLEFHDATRLKFYMFYVTTVIIHLLIFFVGYDTEQIAAIFNISAVESNYSTSEYREITNENSSCANHESSRQVLDDESAAHICYGQVIHAAKSAKSYH